MLIQQLYKVRGLLRQKRSNVITGKTKPHIFVILDMSCAVAVLRLPYVHGLVSIDFLQNVHRPRIPNQVETPND